MWLLLAYGAVVAAVSYLGGYLNEVGQTTHRRTQLIVSAVAGFILGLALFHLIPHSMDALPGRSGTYLVMAIALAGAVTMIFLLHVFHFHSHHLTAKPGHPPHDKGLQPLVPIGGKEGGSFIGLGIGLGVHTLVEGFALGVSVDLSMRLHVEEVTLPGFAVFLAIALHKPLDAYTVVAMSSRAGHSRQRRALLNVGYALLCPAVAFLAYFLGDYFFEGGAYFGFVLAFAGGAFLCVALSDLLPEVQFHSHDRIWLIVALLAGMALAILLFFVQEHLLGHQHGGGHGHYP